MPVWSNDYIKLNKYSRPGSKLTARRKGVLHYTANPGATARNHVTYFGKTLIEMNDRLPASQRRYASAHIFVDKKEAICIIPLNEVAYAANDGTYRGVPALKPNANFLSISVEMCQEKDGSFHPDTIARTEDVFVELSKMYGWNPLNDIVRHYDITHKNCPAPWVSNGQKFIDFKKRVNAKLNGKKPNKPSKPAQAQSKPAASKKPSSTGGSYTGDSIVDYLKSVGKDSSFSNRAKLAAKHGIKNYKGTEKQNLELLNKLRVGGKTSAVAKPAAKKGDQKTGSIVDYLKSIGEDSSLANRKKLAAKYGIKNYSGTAAQNTALLKKMRG